MLGKGRNQKRVNDEIAEDARLGAEEQLKALQELGRALGKPPKEIVDLVKQSGVDPKKPLSGDPSALEELAHEARDVLGDRAAEAEALAARAFPAPAPASMPTTTSPYRRRRGAD